MHITPVSLGKRSYSIYLGNNILNRLPGIYSSLNLARRALLITDSNVARLHLKKLTTILNRSGIQFTVLTIPPGERQKSLARAAKVYDALVRKGFHRKDLIIAFGGGVVGDLSGFVAATFRRGMPYIQIPTTFLAQVESSIGGKTGVNHRSLKNAIGAFHQPKLVFSDVRFLATLPRREIISGLGEAIKYGYIDEGILRFLERHLDDLLRRDPEAMAALIRKCNVVKAGMIEKDERETNTTGDRAVLNLGHTVGQALEVISNYRLRHGEAVLIGLRWELVLAQKSGILNNRDFERLYRLLERVPYKPRLNYISPARLLGQLYGSGKMPRFVLPTGIGKIMFTGSMDRRIVASVVRNELG